MRNALSLLRHVRKLVGFRATLKGSSAVRVLEIIAALILAAIVFIVVKVIGMAIHIAIIGAVVGLVVGFIVARMFRRD